MDGAFAASGGALSQLIRRQDRFVAAGFVVWLPQVHHLSLPWIAQLAVEIDAGLYQGWVGVLLQVAAHSVGEQARPCEAPNCFAWIGKILPFVGWSVAADVVDHHRQKGVAGGKAETPLQGITIWMEKSICGSWCCWKLAPDALKADQPTASLLYKLKKRLKDQLIDVEIKAALIKDHAIAKDVGSHGAEVGPVVKLADRMVAPACGHVAVSSIGIKEQEMQLTIPLAQLHQGGVMGPAESVGFGCLEVPGRDR